MQFFTCGNGADIFSTGKGRRKQIVKILPFTRAGQIYTPPAEGLADMADAEDAYQEAAKTSILSKRDGFTKVNRMGVCQGYSCLLKSKVNDFKAEVLAEEGEEAVEEFLESRIDPDRCPANQLFLVLVMRSAGTPLADTIRKKELTVKQAKSVIRQTAFILAAAEKELEFEHRDLHTGNILLRRTRKRYLTFPAADGSLSKVKTHGFRVTIIEGDWFKRPVLALLLAAGFLQKTTIA
ncbi:Serine/threonine-protein kinase haspin [Quaeritorhiza haematococci]|nr:Serine/threonine-protein kinase haspin [Quaeritorhiza haematococci]